MATIFVGDFRQVRGKKREPQLILAGLRATHERRYVLGQHGRIHGAQPTEKTAPNLCCVIDRQVLQQGAAHTVRIGTSVVSYESSKTVVGRQARERMNKAGLGVQGILVRSPKTLLGKESVYVGGNERNPVDIVRDVMQFVRQEDTQLTSNADPDATKKFGDLFGGSN